MRSKEEIEDTLAEIWWVEDRNRPRDPNEVNIYLLGWHDALKWVLEEEE